MAFRRRFSKRRFRRRSPWDMQTFRLCRDVIDIVHTAPSEGAEALTLTCDAPVTNAVQIVVPSDELAHAKKALMWGGAHFQLEYAVEALPAGVQPTPNGWAGTMQHAIVLLDIWSALVVLPLVPGATPQNPAYLPKLSAFMTTVPGDADCDILWKRWDRLWCADPGDVATNWSAKGIRQLEETYGRHDSTSETSKVRRKLGENEGLFLVRSLVTGIGALSASDAYAFRFSTDLWMRFAVLEALR